MRTLLIRNMLVLVMLAALLAPRPAVAACSDPTCSSHGTCVNNVCVCSPGWQGTICSTPSWCGVDYCTGCSGRGTCVGGNGPNGTCYCADGFSGWCCGDSILPTLTPAGLDFGGVGVGGVSVPQAATLTILHKIRLDTITLSGSNHSDFSLGVDCAAGATLLTGAVCTVTVTFTPTAAGTRTATLTATLTRIPFSNYNPTTTLTTTLTGTGTIAPSSIVIDPTTPTTLYAGLDGAGIYKSMDSGTNWSPAATQPTALNVRKVVIKPGDSATLYAATYGGGVHVSTNTATPFDSARNGMVWSACAGQPANLNVVSLIIDASGKLYAGTEDGVFVSADGCGIWTAVNSGLPN